MFTIMTQIAIYMAAAILLGYFFGWLITRVLFKKKCQKIEKKYEQEIEAFIAEREEVTLKYKELLAKNSLYKYGLKI